MADELLEALAEEIGEYKRGIEQDVPWLDIIQTGDSAHTPQVTPQVRRLVAALGMDQLSAATLKERLGLSDTKSFRALYLRPALNEHLIEMTIPDKPRSRNQQYRLTSKGHTLLHNSGA